MGENGEVRGAESVARFSAAMIETLNQEKNVNKGPWEVMTLDQLVAKLKEERKEVDDELVKRILPGVGCDLERLAAECVDEADVLMMIYGYAQRMIASTKANGGGETVHLADGEWYSPNANPFQHECCDCGLRHSVEFVLATEAGDIKPWPEWVRLVLKFQRVIEGGDG